MKPTYYTSCLHMLKKYFTGVASLVSSISCRVSSFPFWSYCVTRADLLVAGEELGDFLVPLENVAREQLGEKGPDQVPPEPLVLFVGREARHERVRETVDQRAAQRHELAEPPVHPAPPLDYVVVCAALRLHGRDLDLLPKLGPVPEDRVAGSQERSDQCGVQGTILRDQARLGGVVWSASRTVAREAFGRGAGTLGSRLLYGLLSWLHL